MLIILLFDKFFAYLAKNFYDDDYIFLYIQFKEKILWHMLKYSSQIVLAKLRILYHTIHSSHATNMFLSTQLLFQMWFLQIVTLLSRLQLSISLPLKFMNLSCRWLWLCQQPKNISYSFIFNASCCNTMFNNVSQSVTNLKYFSLYNNNKLQQILRTVKRV